MMRMFCGAEGVVDRVEEAEEGVGRGIDGRYKAGEGRRLIHVYSMYVLYMVTQFARPSSD
jgi:hypothetical protein